MWAGGNTRQPDFMEYHYFLDMKLSSFVHHLAHDEVLGIQTTEDVENQEVA